MVGAEANAGVVPGGGAAYVFNVTTGQRLFKLTPTDAAQNEFFGVSVAVSGNRAIIGAYDDHGAQGSAYIFDLSTGQQLFKLTASDAAVSDFFGISVAAKGNLAIIGAEQKLNGGAAYVFNIATGQQLAELLPNDGVKRDDFGIAVGISGNLAVVGSGKGRCRRFIGCRLRFQFFDRRANYKLTGADTERNDRFGSGVAIDGNAIAVGAFMHSFNDFPHPASKQAPLIFTSFPNQLQRGTRHFYFRSSHSHVVDSPLTE